jgi:hypothetical protein
MNTQLIIAALAAAGAATISGATSTEMTTATDVHAPR